MQTKIRIVCSQKDETGKQIFSVEKTETVDTSKIEVNSENFSRLLVNTLALSCQMAKLTNDKNRPKLSKAIDVAYSVGKKSDRIKIKFSLSERRIELVSQRMPQIFLVAYRMQHNSVTNNQLYVNTAGKLVFAGPKSKAAKRLVKKVQEPSAN